MLNALSRAALGALKAGKSNLTPKIVQNELPKAMVATTSNCEYDMVITLPFSLLSHRDRHAREHWYCLGPTIHGFPTRYRVKFFAPPQSFGSFPGLCDLFTRNDHLPPSPLCCSRQRFLWFGVHVSHIGYLLQCKKPSRFGVLFVQRSHEAKWFREKNS